MRFLATVLLTCMAAIAVAHADPIAACRAAHAGDPDAHIACLEKALRGEAAPPSPAGLGAEQAKARQRAPDAPTEQAAVRIVSVRYTASGLGVFRMADGQVWLETVASPERHRLEPGREYAALIERGKLGGYRLYVDGVKWMYKVERLQ